MASEKYYPYDIAISYAREDQTYVDTLASVLKSQGVRVFYDIYEKSTLWGQNLYTYLSDIYQNQAHYCVMFLSQHYATKLWTTHEREAAQARAFKEQDVYILPIRLDAAEIPGILRTTAYLSWHEETVESIADAILLKVGKPQTSTPVLEGRYALQTLVHQSNVFSIYRGEDIRTGRTIAIKILRDVYNTDAEYVTRFQLGAKTASTLQHPNIVQIYDYGQSNGRFYIIMDYFEGTNLRRYIRSRSPMRLDHVLIISHDIATGLAVAHHRGIVHRDVKPENVMIGRDGSVKLTDFNIASFYQDMNAERFTPTGTTIGTVKYFSPEQAQGKIVSPAADVYSLGIIMYEMLTDRTPFEGETLVAIATQHIQNPPIPPSQLNFNIPLEVEQLILRCLQKKPEERYPDGEVLAHAIEMLVE